MMSKEELETKLREIQPKVETAIENFCNKKEELSKEIEKTFSDLTTLPTKINISYGYDLSIRISLVDFRGSYTGSYINIYCRRSYEDDTLNITFDVNSNSTITNENLGEIEKHRMLIKFFDNYDKYSSTMFNFMNEIRPYDKACSKIRREKDDYDRQLKTIERNEYEAQIKATIKVGNVYRLVTNGYWFKKNNFRNFNKMRIDKETEKYYFVTFANNFEENWYQHSGRVEKDQVVRWVMNNEIGIAD